MAYSKRIPRKNIVDFCGKPLMVHALETAKASGLFDEIHVSTEDNEIAAVAAAHGFAPAFPRRRMLADDVTGLFPVLAWVLEEYARRGRTFDDVCLVMPTAPLIEPADLAAGYEVYQNGRRKLPVLAAARISALEALAADTDDRLRRLYKLVEDGVSEMDDILKNRITALKAERDSTRAALDRATGANRPPISLDPMKIAAFGKLMREQPTSGDIPFRKAYLGAIIDRVEVDDHQIRICGRKDVLEQAVIAGDGPVLGVRSFVRRWRPVRGSNPCYPRERRVS